MVPIVLHRELRRPHSRPISFRQNNRSAVRLLQKHAFTASLAALPRLFYPAIAFSRGDLSPLRIRRQVDGKKSATCHRFFARRLVAFQDRPTSRREEKRRQVAALQEWCDLANSARSRHTGALLGG